MSITQTPPLPEKAEVVSNFKKGQRTYHIKKYLGRGGFGITYLAESVIYDDNIPQRGLYTIKEFCLSDICTRLADGSISVSDAQRSEFEEDRQSFIHEAQHLKNMKHNGIVPVNEVFEANGTAFYVMQYLGDTSLTDYVNEKGGHLAEDEACRIACEIADALDYLHKQKVTHLDVKPANVMMVDQPEDASLPVLIDFGLACHYKNNGECTNKHGATGTSDGYSPLEQYAGIERFSPEADVYALAATLFYMLKGKAPVRASKMSEEYLQEELKDLSLSDSTLSALSRALKKNAESRTSSVKEFANQLRGKESGSDDNGTKRSDRNPKPFPWKLVAYIGGVLLLMVSIVFFFLLPAPEPPEPIEMVTLRVVCATSDAEIYIDDQLKGTSPWKGELEKGTYRIEARKTGFRTQTQSVELSGKEMRTVELPELSAQTGNLEVNYIPANAEICLDGKLLGKASELFRDIPLGRHEVEIRKNGYVSKKETVTIAEGQTVSLSGKLTEEQSSSGNTTLNLSEQSSSSYATLNLGYATYKGETKNGKPNGSGKLTFHESRQIESRDPENRKAAKGEYVEGEFSNGHLEQGTWHKNDGTTEYLMIGGI